MEQVKDGWRFSQLSYDFHKANQVSYCGLDNVWIFLWFVYLKGRIREKEGKSSMHWLISQAVEPGTPSGSPLWVIGVQRFGPTSASVPRHITKELDGSETASTQVDILMWVASIADYVLTSWAAVPAQSLSHPPSVFPSPLPQVTVENLTLRCLEQGWCVISGYANWR